MNRKKSREVTMKLLFESMIKGEDYKTILDDLRESNEKEESTMELMGMKMEEDPEDTSLDQVDMGYVINMMKNIQENEDMLDEKIKKYLKGWKINRISKVELAILRLCTYEILFEEDIPERVSINEAIELTKKYCDDKSKNYINAVLDNIAKEVKGELS
ncbi:transcription antitermination factor NusB [Clostridium sp. HMP27]|uniref:transcription antitermination factor NusB n=1 Tax=Clostridium sp. HMP27 TaxID=1487921 RepID=UPI00052D0E0F|nr:transcription antitermination factor NusB [Clostridium sp. HMP27]KGK89048.1 antitermination protein NusB [Clostridium sp. HMP27]